MNGMPDLSFSFRRVSDQGFPIPLRWTKTHKLDALSAMAEIVMSEDH